MPTISTFDPTARTSDLLAALEKDGACIVTGLLPVDTADTIIGEVMPWVRQTRHGGDEFSGTHTRRTGALVARSPACRALVTHDLVLALARTFLGPFTDKILLHLTQTIFIDGEETEQMFHRDRQAWGSHLPASIEPQFNTIWALSDFTAENGATRIAPGSHRWEPGRKPEPAEVCQAQMPKGSVLLYTGSVIHSGGANHTQETRMGLNITYCLGWLRQEENQFLSCPPEIARDLPQDLQELLGYTMGSYALGYYSDPQCGPDGNAGILPPERAVGSMPRESPAITN